MKLFRVFSRSKNDDIAHRLYRVVVRQARLPVFYRDLAVPDTLDGRFDLIVLHLYLIANRLKGAGETAGELQQRLMEIFFADMDQSLREIGIGDLSVGKRVGEMADAAYGRIAVYDQAVEGGEQAVALALSRNVYRDDGLAEGATRLARYVLQQHAHLKCVGIDTILTGDVTFSEQSLE
ncbi:MAG: ubiquinol-cytochrome C chaperone [Sphingomonadales bacterium]|nr:ubiquinol-cytochrome C chaperone [Sphingomonadales bacterium]